MQAPLWRYGVALDDNSRVQEELTNGAGSFGDRMRAAREKRGLSLEAVTAYCGGHGHALVSNWEKGRNFPALERLVLVARLYRASIDHLVWGDEVSTNIEARLRDVPKILRGPLVQRIHDEIDKTLDAAKRLPPEMAGDVVKDDDDRLREWSTHSSRWSKPAPRKIPR